MSWAHSMLLVFSLQTCTFLIHPLFNFLSVTNWLTVKFHYALIGPKVKILNMLSPLAAIYSILFPVT